MLASLNLNPIRGAERVGGVTAPADAPSATVRDMQRGLDSGTASAPRPEEAVGRATLAAIGGLFGSRDVAVSSFHDDATGRMVYRVSDPHSGEVLMQAPSEALLRLYASSREAQGPLLAIEA